MNFKLIMLSLLSLSAYSSIYSMDDKALTEKQIQQVIEYQKQQKAIAKKKSDNEFVARGAGMAAIIGTYKLVPIEYFFKKYKVTNPDWEKWNSLNQNPFFWITNNILPPNKFVYRPDNIQNTINVFKVMASLYAGYKTYKFVKNKLEKQPNS